GEWPARGSAQCDHANWRSFPQERDAKHGAIAADFLRCSVGVFGIGQDIENMKNFALKQHSSRNRASVNLSRVICVKFGQLRRASIGRFKIISCASRSAYHHCVGLAQPGCRLYESVEYGLQIER